MRFGMFELGKETKALLGVTTNIGAGMELQVIAAAVIGGANLAGGIGTAFGALVGSALIEVIRNSLGLLGINAFWQGTFIGGASTPETGTGDCASMPVPMWLPAASASRLAEAPLRPAEAHAPAAAEGVGTAASGSGSIIFMSSTAAVETFIVPQAFNALKAALITYGSQLSQALAAQNIRVNIVSPGAIYYPGGNWETIKSAVPALYEGTLAQMPMGRFGEPDEVAKAIVFMASPACPYMTGAHLVIDGGFTKRVQF